jgi:hypothetical protein
MGRQPQEIDRALVAGEAFRNIAKRFETSWQAVRRRKEHVTGAIVKAAERREDRHVLDAFSRRVMSRGMSAVGNDAGAGRGQYGAVESGPGRRCGAPLGSRSSVRHSALRYCSPAEFENRWREPSVVA